MAARTGCRLVQEVAETVLNKGIHVRATVLVNRLLGFRETVVEAVRFTDTAIVVSVRLSSRMLVCPCGRTRACIKVGHSHSLIAAMCTVAS
jgi:hypothetical protein